MKQIIFAATLLGAIFISNFAEARTPNHNINRSQAKQHQRIQHGMRDGSLTRGEAKSLRYQQTKINHYKRMARADGRITAPERKMIQREQYNANRNIYAQRHDRQRRYH